ncbi:hypothetical protein BDR26DRAFT_850813 [Obelidium mucronatum]|nr:hypothetical protein BDR26DRAFT_850813 [Obelidium mucronatum]
MAPAISNPTTDIPQSRSAARVKRFVSSLYHSAGQKSEMKVWIAKDMSLKLLCDLESGWFFTHNCYVIVNGRKRGNSQYTDVFCWVGAFANETDIGHVLFKGKEIREYIGLTNCAIHKESQHSESTLFLSNFKYLRYTYGDRFRIPSKIINSQFQEIPKIPTFNATANRFSRVVLTGTEPKSPSKLSHFAEAVIYATTLSNQRAQELQSQQQQYLQESIVRNYLTNATGTQLMYAHDSSPHWIYNQLSIPQTRPYLFRIHRANKIRWNAENTSVVIEQVPLSKDFETAVEPPEDGDDDEDDDEDGNKPPTATNLPHLGDNGSRVIPKGWKIWGCKEFVPDQEGVYVLEGVGFVWVFCGGGNGGVWGPVGGLRNAVSAMNVSAPAKVDTGLGGGGGGLGVPGPRVTQQSTLDVSGTGPSLPASIPVPLSQKSDLDLEKCVALDWAKEVAACRGHGRVEAIDDSDIIINKIWISLGIPCKNLLNNLTNSETRLDEWEKDKEQEQLDKLAAEFGEVDPETMPTKPIDKSLLFKDKTPFFHEEKPLGTDPYSDDNGAIILFKALPTNLVRGMDYVEIERNILYRGHLSSTSVYFLDAGARVFVWVGSKCDEYDRANSILLGQKFIIKQRKAQGTIITGLVELGENEEFVSLFTEE